MSITLLALIFAGALVQVFPASVQSRIFNTFGRWFLAAGVMAVIVILFGGQVIASLALLLSIFKKSHGL